MDDVGEESKASWTLGENAEGADAEGVDEDDDDRLNEFTDVSQSTVVEETTASIKESAALLKQKRFQNKSSAVKDFLPATTLQTTPRGLPRVVHHRRHGKPDAYRYRPAAR